MIKLEAVSIAPQAFSLFKVQSLTDASSVSLSTTDAWKPSDDDFVRDDTKRKQVVSYISEGRTVELIGAVSEADAVEIAGAWCVVALTKLVLDKKTGKNALVIQKVVEVWSAPAKCLWRAKEWQEKPVPATASSMDMATGRVSRTAA